jgi:transposase-like protein
VLFREALSSENTPFTKLIRLANNSRSSDKRPASPQFNGVKPRTYRMNRKLSPAERAQLVELYRGGMSALEVAREFGMHRQTVARHLTQEGAIVRSQLKMTPPLVERAKQLYAEGHSTAEVGWQLGVEASTVGKALKRAGVKLRPPVADRWCVSRDE